MQAPEPRRPNRQQIAAAATRREILLAARVLFAEDGYAKTSIAAIADRAGVSIPTIYASVGPKPAIVLALVSLIDVAIAGAETRERIPNESDPAALLALGVHVNRVLHESFGDIVGALRSAAEVESEIAAAVENGRQMHALGATRIADRLAELEALRPGITPDEAADVIGLLTDSAAFATLVGQYGWPHDRAEEWLASALQRLLLTP